jgi:hypothetical protein
MPHKFHYTIELDARGIRRAGKFPLAISDFSEIRQPGLAYFDRTKYIPELQKMTNVQLVCRPRRFGKSLTVSMLRYFHGFQFRNLLPACAPLLSLP